LLTDGEKRDGREWKGDGRSRGTVVVYVLSIIKTAARYSSLLEGGVRVLRTKKKKGGDLLLRRGGLRQLYGKGEKTNRRSAEKAYETEFREM